MKTLGITGNIGSGKSSVLEILKNKGINTYDLDEVAKDYYKYNEDIKKRVSETFPNVLSENNEIDTNKLGYLVFDDIKKLKMLQNIIWPEVENFITKKIECSENLIVFEGAIIVEADWHKLLDHIWIVDTNHNLSKIRVEKERNLSEKKFDNILKKQLKADQIKEILVRDKIDFSIINNNSNLKELKKIIEKETEKIIQKNI
ncbi:MAG: dephospho-CoA kinase [Chloroflexi bacterium]|nr:dephospho-CoA kinase [Chloroflexota bacterium]|tara:strand:+ start:908 stop:1513 length:606 start_codon:yes stop_codon:yes gene_type:complete